MIKVAQTNIGVDKAKYHTVIMAQVELSKLADAIITLEQQRTTLVARINTLLSRPPDAAFGMQLTPLFAAYFAIQRDLSHDNAKAAADHARELLEKLTGVDMSLVKGDMHMAWMKAGGDMKRTAGKLAAANSIQDARSAFSLLSDVMTLAARRFGPVPGLNIFRLHCPMAFDNRGATWLQNHDKVENPYFGSTMFGCGEVTENLTTENAANGGGAA